MEIQKPSLTTILSADSVATATAILAIAPFLLLGFLWMTYALGWAVPVRADIEPPSLLNVVTASALLSSPLAGGLIWWVRVTRRVLRSGSRAHGVAETVAVDRGILRYTFSASGRRIRGSARCASARRLREIREGGSVNISFDPAHPSRSFVRELYLPRDRSGSGF